jgi:uncharacterized protein YegP (UPF0339 family)
MTAMVWKLGNMATEFEIFQENPGQYRCRLKAARGGIITAGRGCSPKAACMNQILKVREKLLSGIRERSTGKHV